MSAVEPEPEQECRGRSRRFRFLRFLFFFPLLLLLFLLPLLILPSLFPVSVQAQVASIPLPQTRLVREEVRRAELRGGVLKRGASTLRLRDLESDRFAGMSAWLQRLGERWSVPESAGAALVHAQTGVQYAPATLENGYRELRISEELSLLTVRGATAGGNWHVLMEADLREKWSVPGRDFWNLPRRLKSFDRQLLRRATLGLAVGPFLVEIGRFGRNWAVGRSGGLLLGGEVRAFDGIAAEASGEHWAFEFFYAPLEPALSAGERAEIPTLSAEAFKADEKAVYMHRLTWRPRPNLRIGIAEAALFFGRRPSIADLGPVLPQHDRYRDYDNLMWSVDARWLPVEGVGLYAEAAADDLRFRGTESAASDPSAFGLLAGIEAVRGPWEGWAEFVLTSDRFYRFRHPLGRWESRLRFGSLTTAWIPDFNQPLGHWVGPDALALFAGLWRAFPSAPETSLRGVEPRPVPRIGARFGYRKHRGTAGPAGTFPWPVELTSPDEPPSSEAEFLVVELAGEWPIGHLGWLEIGVGGIRFSSRALDDPAAAFSEKGMEVRAGLRIPIF